MFYSKEFKGKKFNFTTAGAWFKDDVLNSFFFESEIRDKWWNIQPGDVVIDIGAGWGSYTLPAMALGASMVFAIEPGKEEFFNLSTNITLNSFQCSYQVLPYLVTDKVEDNLVGPYYWSSHSGRPSSEEDFVSSRINTTLDKFVTECNCGKLNWIKIDTEGNEVKILKGGLSVLKDMSPTLLIENHEAYCPGIHKETQDILIPLGYVEENHCVGEEKTNENWSLWQKV